VLVLAPLAAHAQVMIIGIDAVMLLRGNDAAWSSWCPWLAG
jgi:hypothetical protein